MSPENDLIERLQLEGHPRTHAVVVAIKAAALAHAEPRSQNFTPYETGLEAILLMPKKAGQFERGIAAGIAMMLSTEAQPMKGYSNVIDPR